MTISLVATQEELLSKYTDPIQYNIQVLGLINKKNKRKKRNIHDGKAEEKKSFNPSKIL